MGIEFCLFGQRSCNICPIFNRKMYMATTQYVIVTMKPSWCQMIAKKIYFDILFGDILDFTQSHVGGSETGN